MAELLGALSSAGALTDARQSDAALQASREHLFGRLGLTGAG